MHYRKRDNVVVITQREARVGYSPDRIYDPRFAERAREIRMEVSEMIVDRGASKAIDRFGNVYDRAVPFFD